MEKRTTDFEWDTDGHASSATPRAAPNRLHEQPTPATSVDARVLARMVANDIIPRLLLAHRLEELPDVPVIVVPPPPPTQDEIARVVVAAVAMDVGRVLVAVDAMFVAGASHESVLIDLVGGAAHLLGEQWLTDERTFAEVTIGLATLHRVVSVIRQRLKAPTSSRGLVVLLTAPGEQHTLAIHVIGDLLVEAGWDADVRPVFDEDVLVATVATEPVVMVGISVNVQPLIEPLGRIVARVKSASLNRDLTVMLGGGIDMGSHAKKLGAKYFSNAREALAWLAENGHVTL